MLRVIHTADWHLGQTLLTFSREYEHERFLEWLAGCVAEREADALLIAGDVFDSANPPTSAMAMFYRFLAEIKRVRPSLEVIIIAGNHDSPGRLEAPVPLLESMSVRIVGGIERRSRGELRTDTLIHPLRDGQGRVAAWCAAIPFLRACDLEFVEGAEDQLIEGTRATVGKIVAAARSRREAGQALIAVGHCYMIGTQLSEFSERKILGGNQHALPMDVFPADVGYVALGHLHKAQAVGAGERVRYSGSPLPLSLSEHAYRHQVVCLEFEGEALVKSEAITVPRAIEMLRLPADSPRSIDEVLPLLDTLPPAMSGEDARKAYLEVQVQVAAPDPMIRQRVEEALEGKAARLAKLTIVRPSGGGASAEGGVVERLAEITPETVFRRLYGDRYGAASGEATRTPVPDDLLAAFHELIESVERGEEGVPSDSRRLGEAPDSEIEGGEA